MIWIILGISLIAVIYLSIISLGYSTYSAKPKSFFHQMFYIFCILYTLWLISHFLQVVSPSNESAAFFVYMDYITGPFGVCALCIFLYYFPHASANKRVLTKALLFTIPALVACALVASGTVVSNIEYNPQGLPTYDTGAYYNVFSVILLSYILVGLLSVLRTCVQSSVLLVKKQSLCLFFTTLGSIGTVSIMALLSNSHISYWGHLCLNALSLVFVIGVSFTVNQFKLFGIRKFSSSLMISSVIIALSLVVLNVYEILLGSSTNDSFKFSLQILILSICVPMLMRLRNFLENAVDAIYLSRSSRYKHMQKIITACTYTDDIKNTVSQINQELTKVLGTEPTWLLQNKSGTWEFYGNLLTLPEKRDVVRQEIVTTITNISDDVIFSQTVKEILPGGQKEHIAHFMEDHDISMIKPLRYKTEDGEFMFGYLIVWNHRFADDKRDNEILDMTIPELSRQLASQLAKQT